uniref:Uncharacterized protein n=1 Tax=Caenorhabditis japonica TaxID=281687 RepID=A0A8R1IEB6_CAEJA
MTEQGWVNPAGGGLEPVRSRTAAATTTDYTILFSVRSAANALPSHSDGRGRVCDERVQKIKRAVADVLL